jgi:predicted HTH domain antitoxin
MPVIIPDEILKSANLTERDALIEIICHFYDAGKLSKGWAARFLGLSRAEFEDELIRRGMPLLRFTMEMLHDDVETLKKLGRW